MERRLHPRSQVDFPVQLRITSAERQASFNKNASDLSHNGIHINCTQEEISVLLEQKEYPPTVLLSFQPPGNRDPINAHCRLIIHRRLAQDSYHLGFSFVSFEDQGEQALINYLDSLQYGTNKLEQCS